MSKAKTIPFSPEERAYAKQDSRRKGHGVVEPHPSLLSGRRVRLKSGVEIGEDRPCFIVAEVGNNHQGDVSIAREMVRAAAEAGVDAVKFQKRDNKALLTREGLNAPYTGPNSFGKTYGAHRHALELSIAEMAELRDMAENLGLTFFASAWDMPSLTQMDEIGVELIKICSADLVNIPLLRQAGAMELPVVLSTGMSTLEEIDAAVAELRRFHDQIVVLHCNSSYPCAEAEIRLPVMLQLKERYKTVVGYSGHEAGLAPSLAAATLGASLIERHMTLDRSMRGTDHKASLEPSDFAQLVTMVRQVEEAMPGRGKTVFPKEKATAAKLRKSIVAARDIPVGTVLTEEHVTVKSPGTGLSPLHWDDVLGKRLAKPLAADDFLHWDDLQEKAD